MSKVFVVQEVPNRNLVPATKYGILEVLLPHHDVFLDSVTPVKTLRRKLENFSDDDYILLIGDPVAIALSSMVASEVNDGRIQFLKWDKATGTYYIVKVEINRKVDD